MSTNTSGFMTIADYWVMHGYTREEANRIEREQIKYAMEEAGDFDDDDRFNMY